MNIFLVALGGFFGSIARFYISTKTTSMIGTWIANVSGSLLFAIVFKLFTAEIIGQGLSVFLMIGFSGSYTTFSTFGNETLQLILDKRYGPALFYVISTLTISLLFVVCFLYLF